MPKKITLDEALVQARNLAQKAGLKIEVKLDERFDEQPEREFYEKENKFVQSGKRVGPHTVKLTLYARHSVGSGGNMVEKDGVETPENNGYMTFGPGVCSVPVEYAAELEYRDRAAKAADDRFLDRTERTFVIAPVRTALGGTFYRGIEVDRDGFQDIMNPSSFNTQYKGV